MKCVAIWWWMMLGPSGWCRMVVLLLLHTLHLCHSVNYQYSLESCRTTSIFTVDGASILSQVDGIYSQNNHRCTLGFKLSDPRMTFLIRFVDFDIQPAISESGGCLDSLSLWETTDLPDAKTSHVIVNKVCGSWSQLMFPSSLRSPTPSSVYTSMSGATLWLVWITSDIPVGQHKGFHIVITGVLQQVPCDAPVHFACEKSDCISPSLRCDNVKHCLHGGDENGCSNHRNTASNHLLNLGSLVVDFSSNSTDNSYTPATPPTATDTMATRTTSTSADVAAEAYLWLPLIVVVIFTVVMVVLIMVGRKSREDNSPLTEEDSASPHLEINANINDGFPADGQPGTPPPTYSMIERQTSYASYISQSSSQLSVPPEYDEALDYPEEEGDRSRRTSNRHPSSRRQPPVRSASDYARSLTNRFFRRSNSATDGATPQRPRFWSQNSTISESGVENARVLDAGDTSTVFIEEDPPSNIHQRLGGNTTCVVAASVHYPDTSTPSAHPMQNMAEMHREDSQAPLFRIGFDSPDFTESDDDANHQMTAPNDSNLTVDVRTEGTSGEQGGVV